MNEEIIRLAKKLLLFPDERYLVETEIYFDGTHGVTIYKTEDKSKYVNCKINMLIYFELKDMIQSNVDKIKETRDREFILELKENIK